MPDRDGVLAVEIDPRRIEELRYWRPQATVLCHDFLDLEPVDTDVAVLNPPYDDDGEGVFIRQSLLWAPRACALVRTAALSGVGRFKKCWQYVTPTRIALLTHRPKFTGPGSAITKYRPEAEYMAIECVNRSATLPSCTVEFVDWKH